MFSTIQVYYRSRGNLFFLWDSMDLTLPFNIFCPLHVWQVEEGHAYNGENENKFQEKKKKNYHGWPVYTNICGVVVIELFRTILIDTIKENGVTFQKVLI